MKVFVCVLVLLVAAACVSRAVPVPAARSSAHHTHVPMQADPTPAPIPTPSKITVHILPHSHDDAGWVKTFEGYYLTEVKKILDSVTVALDANPERKFNQAEIGFFHRWWRDQTDATKQLWRGFVERGQVEFIEGGWVQPDEAAADYNARIDQMELGHLFLMKEFGAKARPRIAWQIDPFGASSVSPRLYADYGFDAYVTDRIDYVQKQTFKDTKHLEFVWRGSDVLGRFSDTFTHVLDGGENGEHLYCWPPGFNFDWGENVDPPITPANVADRARIFMDVVRMRSAWYKHPHLLLPMGCDFAYQNATYTYTSMDQLVTYLNAHSDDFDVHVRYSTLSEYFDAVHAEDIEWDVYRGDFMPYDSNAAYEWTGYYTSRPQLKTAIRLVDHLLRGAEQAFALARERFAANKHAVAALHRPFGELMSARAVQGIMQHHDCVTGTAKQFVVDNYMSMCANASLATTAVQPHLWEAVLAERADPALRGLLHYYHNQTLPLAATARDGATFGIVLHNTLGWQRSTVVHMRTDTINARVTDAAGTPVVAQTMVEPNDPHAAVELVFVAKVPAAGAATYFVTYERNGTLAALQQAEHRELHCGVGAACMLLLDSTAPGGVPRDRRAVPNLHIRNGARTVAFSMATGLIDAVHVHARDGSAESTFALEQAFAQYPTDKSGAYIFSPSGPAQPLDAPKGVHLVWRRGAVMQQMRQVWGTAGVEQDVSLYAVGDDALGQESMIEFVTRVGPLAGNRELVSRFRTKLRNGRTIVVDNGMEARARPYNTHVPEQIISGNYFPHKSASYIEGKTGERLTVLSRRAMGVSSQREGELEMMLHRRLLQDDGLGMGEAMNDTTAIRNTFYVHVGASVESEHLRRQAQLHLQYPAHVMVGRVPARAKWPLATRFAPLATPLPRNVHLQSFKSLMGTDTMALRLYNVQGDSADATAETVDLDHLLEGRRVKRVDERTLSLNNDWKSAQKTRLKWRLKAEYGGAPAAHTPDGTLSGHTVTVHPQQISSVLIEFAK